MKELAKDIRTLYNESENLVRKEVDLLKMELVEKGARTSGKVVAVVLIIRISLMLLGLLGVSLIFLIGDALGNFSHAVYIVTGIFMLLILILLVFRKQLIIHPFMNYQLGEYLREVEDDARLKGKSR